MRNIAIILAAGLGRRFDNMVPKQYTKLKNIPILQYSIEKFATHPDIQKVLVVHHPDHTGYIEKVAEQCNHLFDVCIGGPKRSESSMMALNWIHKNYDWSQDTRVLIHDAARPNVSHDLISHVLNQVQSNTGVICTTASNDTVWRRMPNHMIHPFDREEIVLAQTPQGFMFHDIHKAYESCMKSPRNKFTDDASVAAAAGMDIIYVHGSNLNLKITHKHDLSFFEEDADMRNIVTTGFDMHAFSSNPERHLKLGGILIPESKGLGGHSDADAVLHAITDAILAACGQPDIGVHFPSNDPRFKDMSSKHFVQHALNTSHSMRVTPVFAHITIIAQTPFLAPFRGEMTASIASILHIDAKDVAITFTSPDKMGSIGRSESIACLATLTFQRH